MGLAAMTDREMIVRRMLPSELADVRDLSIAAFGGDHTIGTLIDALHASWAWDDELSFVAEGEDALLGHVLFTRALVDAPTRLVDALVLSPVGVRPDLHRSGIGSALIRAALDSLEADRTEPLVFLEGHPEYYPRFGFRAGHELGFSAPSVRIPPSAFMVRPFPRWEPWMRGALVYPDAFWLTDSVGLR